MNEWDGSRAHASHGIFVRARGSPELPRDGVCDDTCACDAFLDFGDALERCRIDYIRVIDSQQ